MRKGIRKALLAVGGTVVIGTILFSSVVLAEVPINLFINGEKTQPDVPPQIIEGRTMVPLRWVAETLGAKVDWDEASHSVAIDAKDHKFENQYRYPRLPEEISSPKMLLESYFAALSAANNLTSEQMGAAGGTLGMGSEPYLAAYDYWSPEWRANHPYEEYLDHWSGTAHVELLKLHEADMKNGEVRFFIETKHLESVGENHQFGEFYYMGIFSVKMTEEGWKITEGNLEPQNIAWGFGGHQPWLADPVQVALVGLGERMDVERDLESKVIQHTDDYVTVKIFEDEKGIETSVDLVRPKEGKWHVIAVEKEIPFSSRERPDNDNKEIKYSDEQLQAIHDAGQMYGIEPFIPTEGIATDYLIAVRLKKNVLEMVYPHFAVDLSNQDFMEIDKQDTEEMVTLNHGQTARWFKERRTLYFKKNDVYISMSSAKSAGKEDFVRIARSLTSVKDSDTQP